MKESSKRWGVVVGVDEYLNANERLRNLQGCVTDAGRVCETMLDPECCGFLEDHVKLLENPNLEDLEEAFEKIGGRMAAGDELWFYFAGHGYSNWNAAKGYLLLSDANYCVNSNGRWVLRANGAVSRDQLWDLIDKHVTVGGVMVVYFLDCCCAASVGLNPGDRAVQDSTEVDKFAESFRPRDLACGQPDGETVPKRFMSFCATGMCGRAHEERDGGAFTKRLVEGLRGGTKNQPVAFNENCFYVTAGALGLYVGATTLGQQPEQCIPDAMYPLSISPTRKKLLNVLWSQDQKVRQWLVDSGIPTSERHFAERVLEHEENFEYAGALVKVLRLLADSGHVSKADGESMADVLKAFHELANLLAAPPPETSRHPTRGTEKNHPKALPLSSEDLELLKNVEKRFRRFDMERSDFAEIGTLDQNDAALALDRVARKWMRLMCGNSSRDGHLFSKNEHDMWSMQARNGFNSTFQAAVYELLKDDKALSSALGNR